MATTFATIYDRALFKFADYSFLNQPEVTNEEILSKYLLSAITDFQHMSRIDISDYDLTLGQFNQTLGDDEIEILALGVAYYWLSFKTLNSRLLKNVLNSKDFYYYSPGNLLKEIQTLRKTVYKEYRSMMKRYTYIDNGLADLKANGGSNQ